MNDKTFMDLMRLNHVPRWTIVDTRRGQSVAGHSYNVLLMALYMAGVLHERGYARLDMDFIVNHAIYHDLDEVKTGDIPSPIKTQLGIESKISNREEYVVKVCDVVESIGWIKRYGVRPDSIILRSTSKLNDLMEMAGFFGYRVSAIHSISSDLLKLWDKYE